MRCFATVSVVDAEKIKSNIAAGDSAVLPLCAFVRCDICLSYCLSSSPHTRFCAQES